MSNPPAAAAEQALGPVLFRFTYRSVPCRVVRDETTGAPDAGGDGCGSAVVLRADVGRLPFTVDGPALRSRMLAILDHAKRRRGYRIRLTPDHGIGIAVALTVDGAAPPASVLAAAIGGLADAKPLLDEVLSLLPRHLRNAAGDPQSAS